MLNLRVLKGMTPQIFHLKEGTNVIGRLVSCDVVLPAGGVSKKHAEIFVQDGLCTITDLGSSNGTFVNGVRVKSRTLKPGDRIAFHDVIVELTGEQNLLGAEIPPPHIAKLLGGSVHGSSALDMQGRLPQSENEQIKTPQNLAEVASIYVENVVLPGIYKINESFSTKTIIAGFIFLFAIVVTILATIPMSAMMTDATQKEAQRRALTIARGLANSAERAMSMAAESTIRTDFAEREDGVTLALVVSKEDGQIIAPAAKAHSYANEEFVAKARRADDTLIDQISPTTIGVAVPIKVFSPEAGQQLIAAYAVVMYKMNTLDWTATLGLFARVLIIALLIGFVVFFFIYKVIAHPLKLATSQLDKALRGETNILESKYNFETFSTLISNINSAISRMGASTGDEIKPQVDYSALASNFTRILNDPAITIDGYGKIICVNSHFEELTGMRHLTLQGQTFDLFQDQALKLNMEDLFQKALQSPTQIVSNKLDISGLPYDLDAQAFGDGEKINFVLVTIKKGVA